MPLLACGEKSIDQNEKGHYSGFFFKIKRKKDEQKPGRVALASTDF
jgi:hypothetical protein